MQRKYLLILFIALVLYKCNTNDKTDRTESIYNNKSKNIIEEHQNNSLSMPDNYKKDLIIDKSISFPLDASTPPFTRYLHTFKVNGTSYLGMKHLNTILVYNFQNQQLHTKIEFDKEGPNGIGNNITGFYFINFDSIYISTEYRNTIYLMNDEPKLVTKYDIGKTQTGRLAKFIKPSTFLCNPLYILRDKIYCHVTTFAGSTHFNVEKLREEKMTICYNIKNGLSKYLPFDFSIIAKQSSKPYNSTYSMAFGNNHFIYSFYGQHELYILGPDHEKYTTKDIKSRFINEIENIDVRNLKEDMQEFLNAPKYDNILYDEYRNVYYRFVFLGTEYSLNENIMQVTRNPDNFSIIVFNDNFEILCEKRMPPKIFNYKMAFIEQDGLYLSENHIKNPDYTEDSLKFKLIKLTNL